MKIVVGKNESWGLDSFEVLREEKINVNLFHDMSYAFTDVYMYGMSDCLANKLK